MMESMSAVQIHGYGGPDALVYGTAPRPTAGKGEVLVRIHATTVNPFDCAVRAGYMAGWYNYTFPLIPGLDVSGVVEQVGSGVTKVAVGDAVYTRADPSRNGAYAEYICVPANQVAAKPKAVDHIHAAAVPHVALTAWAALIAIANLAASQIVLIHGAAGGVGHIAVQLAKWRGARVIGTASTANQDFLRQMGVDEAIDYTTTRFEDVVHGVDVVLDTVGGETQERSWQTLKPGGILVSTIQPPSEETAAAHGVRQAFVMPAPLDATLLTEIAGLVDAGKIKPEVSTVLPLQDVQQAHELSERKHTRGKLVLQIVA